MVTCAVLPASVWGQGSSALCAELQSVLPGAFVHGEVGAFLSTATLRPANEPAPVGRAAVKGAMARRLTQELDGVGTVHWASAQQRGPVSCGIFNAYQLLVDPATVRLSAP